MPSDRIRPNISLFVNFGLNSKMNTCLLYVDDLIQTSDCPTPNNGKRQVDNSFVSSGLLDDF